MPVPTVPVNGINISFSDPGGSGTPLLLLHAFPLDSRMWQPQLDALGDRYRLITFDFAGFGGSDAHEDRSSYSVASFAAQADAVLQAAGVEKAVVCGLSLGGYVAMEFLRTYPEKIQALILADTRAEADAPETLEKRTGQQKTIEENGPGALAEGLVGALLGQETRDNKPDVVATLRALIDQPAAGYVGALEAMKKRPDSTEDLESVDIPTLIIVGESDTLTPPDLSRKMNQMVKGSQLVVIPAAGHLSNLEAPEAFNGAVAEFLASVA